jgi:hypothetical protein
VISNSRGIKMHFIKPLSRCTHGVLSGIATALVVMALRNTDSPYPWGFIIFILSPVITALVLHARDEYASFYLMGATCGLVSCSLRYFNQENIYPIQFVIFILTNHLLYSVIGYVALSLKVAEEKG